MISHLDQAAVISSDPPDAPSIPSTTIVHTGRVGRPRIEIDESILKTGLGMRGSSNLASVFGVSSRTVRRRALEYGIAEPGPPVYVDIETEDGSIHRQFSSCTGPMSDISDEEIDSIMQHVLAEFPNFGRRMIAGHFKNLDYRISRKRLQASYDRIHGPPVFSFGVRRIERRIYSVPGPNSLWHHDGQHGTNPLIEILVKLFENSLGLIHWKIVIHAFIDGYSRLVTGIRASNNNLAKTVLDLFLDAVQKHQIPSRIRGDHGVENLEVAAYMERVRGVARGSYIWGRYVISALSHTCWY